MPRNEPAGFLPLAPVRELRACQLGIVIEGGDAATEALLAHAQPGNRRRDVREHVVTSHEGMIPSERALREGIIVVHELAAADVLDDVAYRAVATGREPQPVAGCDVAQVAQLRVPLAALERVVEQGEQLGDGLCGCRTRTLQYTRCVGLLPGLRGSSSCALGATQLREPGEAGAHG
jgi:hypothetical protein